MVGHLLLKCRYIAATLQDVADTVILKPLNEFDLLLVSVEGESQIDKGLLGRRTQSEELEDVTLRQLHWP